MLRGLDTAVAGMRLTCEVDDSQYAIKWDSEPIPCGAEQLRYFPVVLATVPDCRFGSGSRLELNCCQIDGVGRQ